MKALALEGGGVRGSYQVGAYEALIKLGYKFDCVAGTSIGALNGALIASNQFDDLKRLWQDMDIGYIFDLPKDLVDNVNNKKFNMEVVKDVFGIIKNKGINMTNLKKTLKDTLNEEAFFNSKTDFALVTIKRKNLEPVRVFKKDIPKGLVTDYIIASCSLPVFKREKMIDDNFYIDGGFHDLCPISLLVEKGYNDIIAIRVNGIGVFRKVDKKNTKIINIEPSRPLGSILCLDHEKILDNIKMGYYDVMRKFKLYDGYRYLFKSNGITLFKTLNRRIKKTEYRRIKSFFNTNDEKETIIKAIEYMMEKDKMNYYELYGLYHTLKIIKKNHKEDHFIANYIRKLKIF